VSKANLCTGGFLQATFLVLWSSILSGCSAAETDFVAARERMVKQQLTAPGRDITNARVLTALGKVPRHELVPAGLQAKAYGDYPLPIGLIRPFRNRLSSRS